MDFSDLDGKTYAELLVLIYNEANPSLTKPVTVDDVTFSNVQAIDGAAANAKNTTCLMSAKSDSTNFKGSVALTYKRVNWESPGGMMNYGVDLSLINDDYLLQLCRESAWDVPNKDDLIFTYTEQTEDVIKVTVTFNPENLRYKPTVDFCDFTFYRKESLRNANGELNGFYEVN